MDIQVNNNRLSKLMMNQIIIRIQMVR